MWEGTSCKGLLRCNEITRPVLGPYPPTAGSVWRIKETKCLGPQRGHEPGGGFTSGATDRHDARLHLGSVQASPRRPARGWITGGGDGTCVSRCLLIITRMRSFPLVSVCTNTENGSTSRVHTNDSCSRHVFPCYRSLSERFNYAC